MVVSVMVGAIGLFAGARQASGLARASQDSERVLDVMKLGIALLEADGAATNAFLVGGLEPVESREAYDAAISRAATLLAQLAVGADTQQSTIEELNVNLTTYVGLIEAARVNNRQGFPVGSAYLEQGSTLLREQMLPQLDLVLEDAAGDAAGGFAATNWVVLAMLVMVAALAVLIWCQVQLARMTRRRLNRGLFGMTLAILATLVITQTVAGGAATAARDARLSEYRPGLALAQATLLASQARSLESLTLIKRGSGHEYEQEFIDLTDQALAMIMQSHPSHADLLLDWMSAHRDIRELDDAGDWDGALALAVADEDGTPSAAFHAFAEAANTTIEDEAQTLRRTLDNGARSAGVTGWTLAGTGVISMVLVWRGLAARREESR